MIKILLFEFVSDHRDLICTRAYPVPKIAVEPWIIPVEVEMPVRNGTGPTYQ